jgi:hypothetical protein
MTLDQSTIKELTYNIGEFWISEADWIKNFREVFEDFLL